MYVWSRRRWLILPWCEALESGRNIDPGEQKVNKKGTTAVGAVGTGTAQSLSTDVYIVKRDLRKLLIERRFDEIAERAVRKKRVLGSLISLTFDADPQVGWRAVEAMGAVAEGIADNETDSIREHLRRLLWLLSEESGGICWRAPEAMAEIVRRRPALFADYVPIVIHLLLEMAEEDLRHFRGGILWAIGRLGAIGGDCVSEVLPAIVAALDDPDSQVRGMAVWCLAQLRQTGVLAGRPELRADEGPVELYGDGALVRTSVGQLYQREWGGREGECEGASGAVAGDASSHSIG